MSLLNQLTCLVKLQISSHSTDAVYTNTAVVICYLLIRAIIGRLGLNKHCRKQACGQDWEFRGN